MGSYQYEPKGNHPHAPFLSILILHPLNREQQVRCKALLDTGADYTMVPKRLLSELQLPPNGRERSFGGSSEIRALPYLVAIHFDGSVINEATVYGWSRNAAVIGRDLMNRYCIEFNGRGFLFHIN
ncbi:MAG TPA: hypothetical protein DCL61_15450 [Cyanobacteria bacterium UBA12227]|nr:hypothetical protein [Cyanobacteria bacterium UBA12227]HAX88367.1 hypothetical protein [Cyanobacteria bacterium UBA11370]HBY77852.1 hypothetical protein [Cyanobacteria bacterium UBA11148]